jgi:hypothetical protein
MKSISRIANAPASKRMAAEGPPDVILIDGEIV